jgi:hypothetical protein
MHKLCVAFLMYYFIYEIYYFLKEVRIYKIIINKFIKP